MNLKSKEKDEVGMPKLFGYLILPKDEVHNDEELYAAVRKEGRAVLRPFEGITYKLMTPVSLSPEEFERQWQGD